MLLAKCCEDKVRIGNRQEIPLGLRSLRGALAQNPSSADRDAGLANLVTCTLRVVIRIDKAGETGFLVGLQHLAAGEDGADQNYAGEGENERLAPADSAQKQSHE